MALIQKLIIDEGKSLKSRELTSICPFHAAHACRGKVSTPLIGRNQALYRPQVLSRPKTLACLYYGTSNPSLAY